MQTTGQDDGRYVLRFKTKLGGLVRHFIYSENARDSYERFFNYVNLDVKLLRFASNVIGSYSDSFILYAVASLGFCDEASIASFLKAIAEKNPDLQIMDFSNREYLRKRLYALYKNGFLFKHVYKQVYYYDAIGKDQDENVSLYSMDPDSIKFVNQHLDKHVGINTWIQAKPLNELIGWACASYIGSRLAANPAFDSFKEGTFLTKPLGRLFVPCEIKTHTDDDYYTIFTYSYMYHDKRILTEQEFKENCLRKINTILNYLNIRARGNKNACAVVAVQDAGDLDTFIDWMVHSEVLIPHLDKIFFTGEGVVKGGSSAMLQVQMKGNTPSLVVVEPYFLTDVSER